MVGSVDIAWPSTGHGHLLSLPVPCRPLLLFILPCPWKCLYGPWLRWHLGGQSRDPDNPFLHQATLTFLLSL
ncbi:Hypothetical protein NTJ_03356 [Nesidiocoris tenuis]|uniref:Uncharacterized protein n=1 Tax=Nesidiocoris tenuis TaxID=355587 RepID=A0ABN7AEY7_9HEMI|nr:Hypothetical protein NTJ_03356 [Nesidiocoris tenuis]